MRCFPQPSGGLRVGRGFIDKNPYSELLSGVTPREAEITVSELLSQQEAISTPSGEKAVALPGAKLEGHGEDGPVKALVLSPIPRSANGPQCLCAGALYEELFPTPRSEPTRAIASIGEELKLAHVLCWR